MAYRVSMCGTCRAGRDSGRFTTPAGGHSWYGPPISRVWEYADSWYQLFACALFVQSKNGGGARLAPLVELIVSGPPVSSSFFQCDQAGVSTAGPDTAASRGSIRPSSHSSTAGPSCKQARHGARLAAPLAMCETLFANVGLEQVGGQVRLGVLGQRYPRVLCRPAQPAAGRRLGTGATHRGRRNGERFGGHPRSALWVAPHRRPWPA